MSAEANAAALEAALQLLARGDRFAHEIDATLLAKGHSEGAIESALNRLNRRGFLDEHAFAERRAQKLQAEKGYGAERIREELERRGAPPEAIEAAIQSLGPPDLVALLQAKFRPEDPRPRAARYLLGRGFAEEDVRSALVAFFGPEADPD